jgi:hypothetical protein
VAKFRRKKRAKPEAEPSKTGRTEIAQALKEASAYKFFAYRYSMTYELGLADWGRRRADVIGCKISGDLVMVEVKSSVADFRADVKFKTYLKYVDRFYFAFTKTVWDKIQAKPDLLERVPKRAGVLVLGDDGYMKTAKSAKRRTVEPEIRMSVLARLAWRAGDLSKRTQRQRKRVHVSE